MNKPVVQSSVKLMCGQAMSLALSVVLSSAVTQVHADTKVRTSGFEYNAKGLLSKEVIEPDSPNDCLQTVYTYDSFGNRNGASASTCTGASGVALQSAASARATSNSYGPEGRFPLTSTNALSQSESKTYESNFGGIKSLTGPNGLSTNWTYDDFGRKSIESRADGTSTKWAYKLCTEAGASCPGAIAGAVSVWVLIQQAYDSAAAVMGPEQRQYYDTLNRVIRVQTQGFDGGGAAPVLVQDTEYNALGQIARKSNLYALADTPIWESFTYDALGRLTQQSSLDSSAGGGIAVTSYSFNGLSSTVTNSRGQTKTTIKNAQGQIASVVDAQGNIVSYQYDALGNLTRTSAAGSTTTLSYNQRGQKISMQDPAMGSWTYGYNVFGELVTQRDSLSKTATYSYDVLGRMTKRTEADLTSEWSFDKKSDGTACGKGVGKLCEAKTDNGYKRTHFYDALGRISSTSTALDDVSNPAVVSETYNSLTGRVASKTWPTGYQATYTYSALGYLTQVTGGGTNGFPISSYQILAMNAQGQVTQYKTGNNITTMLAVDPQTSRVIGQTATTNGQVAGNVLKHTYSYDSLGNLLTRNDSTPGVGTQESFSYDSLNRLTTASMLGGSVSPPTTTEVMYDQRGNITYKSDVGRYWYDTARPNRMTNVTLETAPGASVALTGTRALSYAFDDAKSGVQTINGVTVGNGNLEYTVSQDTINSRHTVRFESYTSFNMPNQIEYGNFVTSTSSTADRKLSFIYGPEHQRIRQKVELTGNGTSAYFAGSTWYLNGEDSLGLTYEKEIRANGTTEHKHYLSAGGVNFALFTSRTGTLNGLAATTTSYFHPDQLGSVAAITNEVGVVTERLAYDPWGKRRFIGTTPGQPDKLDVIVGIRTDRGYTGHEHLDEVGIIHMNGRIYDPLMGRFMSADPLIEAPYELASYNRYSYVWNNPLNRTDPSGFCWICDPVGETMKTVNHIGDVIATDPVARGLITVAIGYYTGQWVGGANGLGMGAVWGGAAGGAAAAAFASNGDINAIAVGALTGAGFGWAGGVGGVDGSASYARYAAHAAVGCASSVASGGQCGSGAASAVFGKWASNSTASWGPGVAQFTATVVAGGVGSVIAGGKFENGATTAAYGYLFNALSAKTIRSLFTTPGHHPFTRQMAIQFTDVMTDEAVDYVSRRTIGEHVNWDRADPNNPHKWSNEAGHPQYNKDALDIGNKYIEANGISKDNPMTVRQAAELEMKLRQHEYNRSVQDYTNQQMRSGNIRWRGVSRSSGGSSGGPE